MNGPTRTHSELPAKKRLKPFVKNCMDNLNVGFHDRYEPTVSIDFKTTGMSWGEVALLAKAANVVEQSLTNSSS